MVSKCGMPLGYEVFEGNRNDVKTWREIVTTMEARYGKADRIWCGDRGMMSKENIEFMESGNRRYIIGASKGTLKKFERELLEEDWRTIRDGLEVKLCRRRTAARKPTYCVAAKTVAKKRRPCTSGSKSGSTRHWKRCKASCQKRKWKKEVIDRRIGKIMAKNSRAAGTVRGRGETGRRTGRRLLDEEREVARLGHAQRGLLPAAYQRDRLVGRRLVAGVHPVDRGRGGVSDPQERPADPSGLASERGPRAGPHPGLLPGLCAVEDAAAR